MDYHLTMFKISESSIPRLDFWGRTVAVLVTLIALVGGGIWGYYQFWLQGTSDWMANMQVDSEVHRYRDNLKLLVVHVKVKNPRNSVIELHRDQGDSYLIEFRKVAPGLKERSVVKEHDGELLASHDVLADAPGGYQLLPGAEFVDTVSVVVAAGQTVQVLAAINVHVNQSSPRRAKEADFVSASAVVSIE